MKGNTGIVIAVLAAAALWAWTQFKPKTAAATATAAKTSGLTRYGASTTISGTGRQPDLSAPTPGQAGLAGYGRGANIYGLFETYADAEAATTYEKPYVLESANGGYFIASERDYIDAQG